MNDDDRIFPYKPDHKDLPSAKAAAGVLREWAIHGANFPSFFFYGESMYAIWDKKDAEFYMGVIRLPQEADKQLLARVIGGIV